MAAVLLIIAGMMWLANVILAVLSLVEGICAKQCSFSLLWRIVACMVTYLAVYFVHSSLMEDIIGKLDEATVRVNLSIKQNYIGIILGGLVTVFLIAVYVRWLQRGTRKR